MIKRLLFTALCSAVTLGGCSKPETASQGQPPFTDPLAPDAGNAPEATPIDACALPAQEKIREILGDVPAQTKPGGETDNGFVISLCFFQLPPGSESFTLRVVQRAGGPGGRDPKQVWKETFHKKPQATDGPNDPNQPRKVEGAGEEAFWVGDLKRGGLYVLKGNIYVKVAVGGMDDLESKIKRTSALAEAALAGL